MTEMALLSPRPAHVPEALLYDFDISHDPLFQPDLHTGLIELARRTPEICGKVRQICIAPRENPRGV